MKKRRTKRTGPSSVHRPAARARKSTLPLLKEEFLAMVFRLSPHPIGITELETGCCLEVNDACLEIFGFRRDEVIGRTTLMLDIWPAPEERTRLIERLNTERSVRDVEVTMRTKSGDLRRFLISADLVKLGKKRCLLTIGNDITERNRAEEALRQLNATLEQRITERSAALRESEERFRTFFDHAPNLAFMKMLDGRYLHANRRFVEAFGLEHKGIVGKTDAELFSRGQAEHFRANDLLVLESGTDMEFEERPLYRDGIHTNLVVKFPLRDQSGQIYATGGIVTDITDRKKAEDDLRQSQEELRQHRAQLQDLASKLISAQEQERQRIARDLHDDISQRMAALVLDIAALEQQSPVFPGLILQRLKSVREQLELLADDLHSLAYKLHPSLLMHAGLQPAVEDLIHQITARTGLRILSKTNGVPPALSHDQSICLFRVLQESLQNIVKHAKATKVTVRVTGSSKGVGMSVTDDGQGFDLGERTVHQKGLGLISMQERLRLLNGFLNIHSRLEEGTKVCAWIPLKAPDS